MHWKIRQNHIHDTKLEFFMAPIVGFRDFMNTTKNKGPTEDCLKRVNSRQLGHSLMAHPIKQNHFTLYYTGLDQSLELCNNNKANVSE